MSIYSTSEITYIYEKGAGLTAKEVDNNLRSLFWSASLQDGGQVLRLHRDINDSLIAASSSLLNYQTFNLDYTIPSSLTSNPFIDIPLSNAGGGSSGITISGNTNDNILTATGVADSIQGESNLKFNGSKIILTGSIDLTAGGTTRNIFIGEQAGNSNSSCTVTIGFKAGTSLTGNRNTVLGAETLVDAAASSRTTAIGHCTLGNLTSGNFNTVLGAEAGCCVTSGNSNVLLGYGAGPSSGGGISNKLYINNQSGSALICGDFSTGHVQIKTALSASQFSGSYYGDGSNLTGVNTSAFPFNGNAVITGSLTVSGSSVVVNLTNAAAISGSIFSGSYVGDGSGLTGVSATTFPFTGSAGITGSLNVVGPTSVVGSFNVSGSSPTIDLKGVTTIDEGLKIHTPCALSIGIGANSLGTNSGSQNVAIGYRAACNVNPSQINITVVGSCAGQVACSSDVAVGSQALNSISGGSNVAVGYQAMGAGTGIGSVNAALGYHSLYSLTSGKGNAAIGDRASQCITTGKYNSSLGSFSLRTLDSGEYNIGIGYAAGCKTVSGDCNVYIGHKAGPSTNNTIESNKLYISNDEGTPLIKGDFSSSQVEFSGGVSGSFSGSFKGDGSNLTGVTADWDGSRNGDSSITGSLTVSGSTNVVDFTNVAAISGSTFSGSFVGNGSGLTGVTAEWDGTRNGDANITGSLIVSGALDVGGVVTVASSYPGSPGVELIHVHSSSLSSTTTLFTFPINGSTNYTGFKADYSLTNSAQSSKKIGTVLASWNPAAGSSVVNEEHTLATGDAVTTSFSVDASNNTQAIFKVNVTSGTFEINTLITAFKRVV